MFNARTPKATLAVGVCLLLATSFQGCKDDDVSAKVEEKPKSDYFDFSTTSELKVNLDYGFSDYHVVFELHDANTMSVDADGVVTKLAEPLYRSVTDKNGVFDHEIILPSYVSEVYLYSDDLGTMGPVKLQVKDGMVSYNQKEYLNSLLSSAAKAHTRGTTATGKSYPEGYLTLSDWDSNGRPTGLKDRRYDINAQFLKSISSLFVTGEKENFPDVHPELFPEDNNMDIHVTKATTIDLVFLKSGAGYENSVGYYTYPTNNPPKSREEITNPVIAFPRVTSTSKKAAVYYGDQIQLKYYDGTQFVDEFPAGTSIGFFIISEGYSVSAGNVSESTNNATFYSTSPDFRRFNTNNSFLLNDTYTQRAAALLHDDVTKHMISLTFEDRMSSHLSNNYFDASFYLHITEADAVEVPGTLPSVPGVPSSVSRTFSGTLAFEDLWPRKGDYDMNDLVIEYKSTQYYNPTGGYNIIKVVDEFTPKHDGAEYKNGFGYQLAGMLNGSYAYTTPEEIRSVKIESKSGKVSKFMLGADLEPNQGAATIILFDDMSELEAGETFTVTIELDGVFDRKIWAPYNPFIIIDGNRPHEVHLVNYPPTDLANMNLLGTKDDVSRPEDKLYYVSNLDYPFAIHIANYSFRWPTETVAIDLAYPEFAAWAESKGTTNKTWYKNPIESLID